MTTLDLTDYEVVALAAYLRQKQANGLQHPPVYATSGPFSAAMKRAMSKVDMAARTIQAAQDQSVIGEKP